MKMNREKGISQILKIVLIFGILAGFLIGSGYWFYLRSQEKIIKQGEQEEKTIQDIKQIEEERLKNIQEQENKKLEEILK